MAKFDSEKLLAHLRSKWGSRSCPMCHGGPWQVQDSIFQLLEFNEGGLRIGGPVIPVVPVICGNCGNTMMVNALSAGALKKPEVPAKEPAE